MIVIDLCHHRYQNLLIIYQKDNKCVDCKCCLDCIRTKNEYDVYTENINKIALSNNDDKRIVSSDKITSYPYGYRGKHAIIE